MNQTEQKKLPGSNTEHGDQYINDAYDVSKRSPYTRRVSWITAYYMALVLLSLLILIDTMSGGRQVFLSLLGFDEIKADHLIRTVVFVATGSLLGNVLYQIRQLYKAHCKPKKPKDSFNPRWLGKYLSAPWEAVGLALIVVALIGGDYTIGNNVPITANQQTPTIADLQTPTTADLQTPTTADLQKLIIANQQKIINDAQKDYPTSHLSTFLGFGLGGLLGFGIREVVGWLGAITTTMFPTKK